MPDYDAPNLPEAFNSELLFDYLQGDQDLEEHATASSSPLFHLLQSQQSHYAHKHIHSMGGMKIVCKADDLHTGRQIAMAEMKKVVGQSSEEIEQFLREARITANLEHPNIVPVYDIGLNSQGRPYFTMKYLRDQSLKKVLHELAKANPTYTKKYTLGRLLEIYLKVCEAVSYAHARGVVHLDIKPDNILIGDYGEVYICDWGLAKIIDQPESPNAQSPALDRTILSQITLSGTIKGTPGFMAPEQIRPSYGEKNTTTDIYALGALLYNLLTFKAPFAQLSPDEMLNHTLNGPQPDPQQESRQDVPDSLKAVCQKAMSIQQNRRYQNLEELIADIRAYLEGFATRAENASFFKTLRLFIKRHTLLMTLFLLVGVSMFGLILFFTAQQRKTQQGLTNERRQFRQNLATLHDNFSASQESYEGRIRQLQEQLQQARQSLIELNNEEAIAIGPTYLIEQEPNNLEPSVIPAPTKEVPKNHVLKIHPTQTLYTGVSLSHRFTISLKIKSPKTGAVGQLALQTDDGGDGEFNLRIINGKHLECFSWKKEQFYFYRPDIPLKADGWNELRIVHGGKNEAAHLFINQEFVGQYALSFSRENWGQLIIRDSQMLIDDLQVWDGLQFPDHATRMPLSAQNNRLGYFDFERQSTRDQFHQMIANRVFSPAKFTNYAPLNELPKRALALTQQARFIPNVDIEETFTIAFQAFFVGDRKANSFRLYTDDGGPHELGFHVTPDGGILFSTHPGGGNTISTGPNQMQSEAWQSVVLVHRGENQSMELWVNGQLLKTAFANYTHFWGKLKIEDFEGMLDNLYIWSQPLNHQQIRQYFAGSLPLTDQLSGFFNFESAHSPKNIPNRVPNQPDGRVIHKYRQ